MRHWRTSACHLYLSFDRISSSMAFVSGREPQDLMMARIEQKQAEHTQHVLRALPLLIMFLRGIGGPQSNSQDTSVSSSLATPEHISESVPVLPCVGHCVKESCSSVAHESCHSAKSSVGVSFSAGDVHEADMAPGTQTRGRRGTQMKPCTTEAKQNAATNQMFAIA